MSVENISPIGSRERNPYEEYYAYSPFAVVKPAAKEPQQDEGEKKEIEELKKRDTQVRQHEQAHMAVAGQYARGGAKFEFKTGPDGTRYAIGGEVQIDTSPVKDDPAATIRKMQIVQKAALAPADPSGQDYSVAAQARQAEMQARQELAQKTVDLSA